MTETVGVVRVRIVLEGEYPPEDRSVRGQRVKSWLQGSSTMQLLHLLRWIAEALRARGVSVEGRP